MKKIRNLICVILISTFILISLFGCGNQASDLPQRQGTDPSAAAPYEDTSPQNQEQFTMPDPVLVLPDAAVSQTNGVELEIDGGIYVFTQYTYQFSPSANLMDNSLFLTYQMLVQAAGMELEHLYTDGTYSEYAILQGNYFLGYFVKDINQWDLFLPSAVVLDDTPSGNGSGGTFQNDPFGIQVQPGETVPDSGGSAMVCESCGGSGVCDACGGDGWADNIYYGEHNDFECTVCDQTGVCPVCDGEGVWIFD